MMGGPAIELVLSTPLVSRTLEAAEAIVPAVRMANVGFLVTADSDVHYSADDIYPLLSDYVTFRQIYGFVGFCLRAFLLELVLSV